MLNKHNSRPYRFLLRPILRLVSKSYPAVTNLPYPVLPNSNAWKWGENRFSTQTTRWKFPDQRVPKYHAQVWENRLLFPYKTWTNFSGIDISQPTPSMSLSVPWFSLAFMWHQMQNQAMCKSVHLRNESHSQYSSVCTRSDCWYIQHLHHTCRIFCLRKKKKETYFMLRIYRLLCSETSFPPFH